MNEDLTPEEGMEVLGWAYRAATAVVLMQHHPEHSNTREALEMLNNFRNTVGAMYSDLPEVLFDAAADLAEQTIENVNREEDMVEDFMEQVEAYGNES